MKRSEGDILFDTDDAGVGLMTLNRPDRLNAFGPEMLALWHEILMEASDDQAVKVIVITGAGRAFSAGGDMKGMVARSEEGSLERKNYLWRELHRIALDVERIDKPIIAAINGAARGGGLDMALLCDLRLAAESATFAETYINMGLIAGGGGTYFLPRLIGVARALELFWTGRVVTAAEAERMGMLNRVVPDALLLPQTLALAREIAGRMQATVQLFKRAIYQGLATPLATHLDMVSSHASVLRGTDEHRALVAAAVAKITQRSKPA